ncbi:Hypothetical predicted protein [Octopus vulgaris]|uniref:Uncharacterized protein n=1 Tax=Octopus vulgaris TaxID=6645 RepID=A0AA36AGZ9_OCTVU|nr:Hypothetical predicted protein [Octopus vulgaris]
MAQTDAFLERMDKRRQGLWADQQELEVADGSALEDRCWTGDSDGLVGREASSETDSEGSVAEPGLVAEICDAVPKKSCDLEPVEVEETERPVEGVMADAVVPCLEPLPSRPLSLGARDEELNTGMQFLQFDGSVKKCWFYHDNTTKTNDEHDKDKNESHTYTPFNTPYHRPWNKPGHNSQHEQHHHIPHHKSHHKVHHKNHHKAHHKPHHKHHVFKKLINIIRKIAKPIEDTLEKPKNTFVYLVDYHSGS